MTTQSATKRVLPLFRKDLQIYRGPDESDGSPTFNLLDPIKGQYYKLSWKESLIFRTLKPDMTSSDLADEVNKISTLKITAQEIEQFFFQLAGLDLLRLPKGSEHYQRIADIREQSFWMWLLHHYLYIRIPILNPDKFLTKTLKYVSPLGSSLAFVAYISLTFLGLYLVLGQFDQFWHTFTYFFNLEGFIIYALAISAVKIIHEFSHAYVAKRYRLHVPAMGIALIVLWPVLYTDVTDGWKLSNRWHRLAISFAGIAAELVIAGFSTLGWVLTNPGMLQSVFFVLASTSWISTLAINLNPAVRFDGYYILSDLWGIDNLQGRAFAVTRWKFLDIFFGVKTENPEEDAPSSRIWGLIFYAIYTIVYRIFLYTAIALFVYYEFTKALGILLFFAEVIIFMIWPIEYEIRQIYKVRNHIKMNFKSILSFSLLALAVVWLVFPWPHRLNFPAAIQPVQEQIIYFPQNSKIQKVNVKRGDQVQEGDILLILKSIEALRNLGQALLDQKILEKELQIVTLNEADQSGVAQKKAELAKAKHLYEEMERKKGQLVVKAELNGRIYSWDENLQEGVSVSEGAVAGKIAAPKGTYAIAYVPETDYGVFHVGQKAQVILENPLKYLQGTVERIDSSRDVILNYPALASYNKGPLPVVTDATGKSLFLVESYYKIFIKIEGSPQLRYGELANVRIRGPWRSHLVSLIQSSYRIFLRESSL